MFGPVSAKEREEDEQGGHGRVGGSRSGIRGGSSGGSKGGSRGGSRSGMVI